MEFAKQVFLQWPGSETPLALRWVPARILLPNLPADRFHIRLGLLKADARFEATDHVERLPQTVIKLAHFGWRRTRHNEFNIGWTKIPEARGQNADYSV